MKAKHTPGPWHIDDGFVRMDDQVVMLQKNIGTKAEWVAVGINDTEGFAEVVALCHPINAPVVAAVPDLLAACIEARTDIEDAIKAEVCSRDDFCGTLRVLKAAIAKAINK